MATTTYYDLYVTNDTSTTFQEWRSNLAGTTNSNMTKIDNALHAKIDADQGTANRGKAMVVGDDGIVIPTEYTSGLNGTQYSVTIPYTSWSTSGSYFTKTVNVSGIKSTYNVSPVVDCVLSGTDVSSDNAILEAFSKINTITTNSGNITIKATEQPTVNIPIIINVWE